MRNATICLLVLLCSSGITVGQTKVPQWRVVYAITLKRQSSEIPQTTLFTPTRIGVYRFNCYMAGFSHQAQPSGWNARFMWQDVAGTAEGFTIGGSLGTHIFSGWINPVMFSPRSGTPFTYFVGATDPPPENAFYDLACTVEQLK